jgi:decaprenyl-phosphate phosphoribosyltransferase
MLFFHLFRINQWIKNFLIFTPLFFSHNWYNLNFVFLVYTFFSFSILCSTVYIFNDLNDYNSDKNHPTKKTRPIASGKIKFAQAKKIFYFFILINLINFFINYDLVLIFTFSLYFLLNIIYTKFIKKIKYLDILCLSSFYIIRIFIGSLASGLPLSNWLLICSLLFFISFSCLKRANETIKYNDLSKFGRVYSFSDFKNLQKLFISLGYLTAIVFSMYIFSDNSKKLYDNNYYLMPISITLFFLIHKISKDLINKKINDDPTLYVILDKWILLSIFLSSIFFIKAY